MHNLSIIYKEKYFLVILYVALHKFYIEKFAFAVFNFTIDPTLLKIGMANNAFRFRIRKEDIGLINEFGLGFIYK